MLNWQLQERPTTYLIFQNALTVAETLLTLLFVVVQRWGWEGRIGANLIAGTFFGATSLLYFVSKSNVRLMYRDITKLWRIGLEGAPMILHGVGGWLISSMDRFLIVAIVSASSGGIYSMASQVASIVGFVTLAFNQAWSPYLYKELSNSGEASKVKLVKITYVYAFVLFALCCVCCLLFVYAIPYIFDNRYAGATKYLPLMLGQMFFWGMYYMVTNYIFYAKKTSILAKLTLVNGCISFLLNIVTIPRYGPWGSAFCGFFISFTYFASVWILSQKIYPMPWKKVIITWIACISNTVRKA
jgi:O-antigen/teichoic acid export membrane protein